MPGTDFYRIFAWMAQHICRLMRFRARGSRDFDEALMTNRIVQVLSLILLVFAVASGPNRRHSGARTKRR